MGLDIDGINVMVNGGDGLGVCGCCYFVVNG